MNKYSVTINYVDIDFEPQSWVGFVFANNSEEAIETARLLAIEDDEKLHKVQAASAAVVND
jgi:hypothetical protein